MSEWIETASRIVLILTLLPAFGVTLYFYVALLIERFSVRETRVLLDPFWGKEPLQYPEGSPKARLAARAIRWRGVVLGLLIMAAAAFVVMLSTHTPEQGGVG